MFRRPILVLTAAGLISIGGAFAAAQDAPANSQQNPPAQGSEGGHHRPDPVRRTRELTKQLNLNSDQQSKVLAALESQRTQMDGLRQDTSLSQQDRRARMGAVHNSTNDQIRGLLDSSQQQKWDQMEAKHEQWMQNGRSGAPPEGGASQEAPPPQQ